MGQGGQELSFWKKENVQPKNGQMVLFPRVLPGVTFRHLTIFLP
jgi:hypothetical protein